MGSFHVYDRDINRERIVLQTRPRSLFDRSILATAAQVALLAIAATVGISPVRSAEPAGFLSRAPGQACLAAYSQEVSATCAAFQNIALGKSLAGPDFAPLIKELQRLDWASPLHLRPAFGFDWADLAAVRDPGGIVIFRLGDNTAGAAWVFTPASPVDNQPALLAAASRYFTGRGYRTTTEQRPRGTLTLLVPRDAKSGSARAMFVGQGFYGAANTQAAAEAILNVAPRLRWPNNRRSRKPSWPNRTASSRRRT